MRSRIIKNSTILFFGQLLVKGIAFFYTIFLARNLGVYNFGLYVTALAYFSLFSSFTELGLNRFLIKEGAKNSENLQSYVFKVALLRLVFTTVLFALFALWIYNFDHNSLRVCLSLFAVMAIIPQSVALTFDSAFIAKQKIYLSSIGILIMSVCTTILGVIWILNGFSTMGAIAGLVFGQMIYMLFLLIMLFKEGVSFKSMVNWREVKEIAVGSLPYGILGILGILYFKLDTILLSYIKGPAEAGIYGAGYKFLEAIVLLPSSLAIVIFPVLVKLHETEVSEVRRLSFKIIKVMSTLGILFALVFIFVLPIIINLFLPSYQLSIEVIRILAISIPFIFIHVPLSQVLLSSDKYLKGLMVLSVFPLTLNIILNLIFMPRFGFMAASWVTVVSDIFSLLILLIFMFKYFFRYVR
jgi:O-antigen/teichoic acid export membrane protein